MNYIYFIHITISYIMLIFAAYFVVLFNNDDLSQRFWKLGYGY